MASAEPGGLGGRDAMSTGPSSLDTGIAALKRDLLAEGGARISTMRNYNVAILCYRPTEEFRLRQKVRGLSDEMRAEGWVVLSIDLHRLLFQRLRAHGDLIESVVAREKSVFRRDPGRALKHLEGAILPELEGQRGLASDVVRLVDEFAERERDRLDRALVIVGRAGALYPFLRVSALLQNIQGHTRNIPLVILYPGERKGHTALSFMDQLTERDYRPRIYP